MTAHKCPCGKSHKRGPDGEIVTPVGSELIATGRIGDWPMIEWGPDRGDRPQAAPAIWYVDEAVELAGLRPSPLETVRQQLAEENERQQQRR